MKKKYIILGAVALIIVAVITCLVPSDETGQLKEPFSVLQLHFTNIHLKNQLLFS